MKNKKESRNCSSVFRWRDLSKRSNSVRIPFEHLQWFNQRSVGRDRSARPGVVGRLKIWPFVLVFHSICRLINYGFLFSGRLYPLWFSSARPNERTSHSVRFHVFTDSMVFFITFPADLHHLALWTTQMKKAINFLYLLLLLLLIIEIIDKKRINVLLCILQSIAKFYQKLLCLIT